MCMHVYMCYFQRNGKEKQTDMFRSLNAFCTRQGILKGKTKEKISRVSHSLHIHAHQRQVNETIILFDTELAYSFTFNFMELDSFNRKSIRFQIFQLKNIICIYVMKVIKRMKFLVNFSLLDKKSV